MLPFSPPRIDDKIIDAVSEVLRSGWITTGPRTKLFENKITRFCDNKATLCVSSASAGLELILRWFGVKKGDEVIVPAYTYCATANVVIHCGAKPVLVDINSDDYNISIENVRKAVTNKTKVIIPVDIAGLPCDYNSLNTLVRDNEIINMFSPDSDMQRKLGRILILADAAHSLGAFYNLKKTGTLTDITVFSFHAVKNLTTAEGGAICLNLPDVFDCDKVYRELSISHLHGQTKDALSKSLKGNWKYDVVEAGYKYNMTDIQAAIGIVELDRYDSDMLKKREYIFNLYSDLLNKYSWFIKPVYSDNLRRSSFHVYLARVKNISENLRDNIIDRIFSKNISVNVHFIPLPMLSFYSKLGFDINKFPVSYQMFSNTISLPVYYDLTDSQIYSVVNAFNDSVNEILKS